MKKKNKPLEVVGWREWVGFPELSLKTIKAKIDTGARTSALHVSHIEILPGTDMVRFKVHPVQREARPTINASAKMIGERSVKSSNGESSTRPVIKTKLKMGKKIFSIELTLVNRDLMGFRLLLGRSALKERYLVDSGKSFLLIEDQKVKRNKK